jgi:tRNA dimethylallyltransferase
MDIGTAKPTTVERAAVRHHLIDIADPDELFDAASFARLGREIVRELHRHGKTAVVAGGTGLYIKALLRGLVPGAPADPALRRQMRAEAQALGAQTLHARLARCDPETAARVHPNDTFRILRALEVFALTGRPISRLHREHRFGDAPFRALLIGLGLDRAALYARIDRRVDAMMEAGLVDEVRGLAARGYGPELKSMQSIGYSHVLAFLAGRLTREECVRTLKRDTRRFAKRQLTWLRAQTDLVWAAPEPADEVIRLAEAFIEESSKLEAES